MVETKRELEANRSGRLRRQIPVTNQIVQQVDKTSGGSRSLDALKVGLLISKHLYTSYEDRNASLSTVCTFRWAFDRFSDPKSVLLSDC